MFAPIDDHDIFEGGIKYHHHHCRGLQIGEFEEDERMVTAGYEPDEGGLSGERKKLQALDITSGTDNEEEDDAIQKSGSQTTNTANNRSSILKGQLVNDSFKGSESRGKGSLFKKN